MERSRSRNRIYLVLVALALLVALATWRPIARALLGPPEVVMLEAHDHGPGGRLDHAELSRLLARHVDEHGRVDYRGLAAERSRLDAYIGTLASVPFNSLTRDEKLALLINAYNAFTLQLVLDHYPLESILDIPSRQRWTGRTFELAGEHLTLEQIEHEHIRPRFREARIHFALVCASIGCPPLRTEAYEGRLLDEQLEHQARRTHADPANLQIDAQGVALTRLYDWYSSDFQQISGSTLAFAAMYSPSLSALLKHQPDLEVRFLDYDWSLNDQSR